MNNSIKLVKIYPQGSESSLDLRIEVNGKEYELAIRFLQTDKGKGERITVLRDPSLWHMGIENFGTPHSD